MIGNKGNIDMPNINGMTDSEKITQIIRYLYRLVDQLNWSMDTSKESAISFDVKEENGAESLHLHMKRGSDTYTVSFSSTDIKYKKNEPM